MKTMTLAEYRQKHGSQGELLPWAKLTDIVHECPGKAGPIALRADGTCPNGCHKKTK